MPGARHQQEVRVSRRLRHSASGPSAATSQLHPAVTSSARRRWWRRAAPTTWCSGLASGVEGGQVAPSGTKPGAPPRRRAEFSKKTSWRSEAGEGEQGGRSSRPARQVGARDQEDIDMADRLAGADIAFLTANEGVEQVELADHRQAVAAEGGRPVLVAPEAGEVQAFNHRDRADRFPVDVTSPAPIPGSSPPWSCRGAWSTPTGCAGRAGRGVRAGLLRRPASLWPPSAARRGR